MKIICEHPCFPLYKDCEIRGRICSVYMWCSSWGLKLALLKTSFSKQTPDQKLPARPKYHHQERAKQLSCSSLAFISWDALIKGMAQTHPIIFVLHEDWNSRIRISHIATMAPVHTHDQGSRRQSCFTAFYQHNTTETGKAQISKWEAPRIRCIIESVAFLKHLNGDVWDTKTCYLGPRLWLLTLCHYTAINRKYIITPRD